MVSPNLLQPTTDIDDVVESGPLAPFAEVDQPANDRLERAKIQGQEKPKNGR